MKINSALKMIGFVGAILTSSTLFILYIKGIEPSHKYMIHLHVWLGLLFIIFAVTKYDNGQMQRKTKKIVIC